MKRSFFIPDVMLPLLGVVIGLGIGAVTVTTLDARQDPAPTIECVLANDTEVSGTRPVTWFARDNALVSTTIRINGGVPLAQSVKVTGGMSPQDPITVIEATAELQSLNYTNGTHTVTITATDRAGQTTTFTRTIRILNPLIPTTPTPPPAWQRSTNRFIAAPTVLPGRVKIADAQAGQTIEVEWLSWFTNGGLGGARLVAGTGSFCSTDRVVLSSSYPISSENVARFGRLDVPTGLSLCVELSAAVATRGDARFRVWNGPIVER